MKKIFLVSSAFLLIIGVGVQTAPAQLPGGIPRIPRPSKPKATATPTPAPTEPAQPTQASGTPTPAQPQPTTKGGSTAPPSGGPYAVQPEPPESPLYLADTLEIQVETWSYYWKIPNDNHNTSWVPRIRFFMFYGGEGKQRFKADYFMPDGSLWFSEALEFRGNYSSGSGLALVQSESDSNRDKKAVVTGGLFGIKITNIRDNSTVFQGKFKVNRYKPQYSDARYKNEVDYYVDYDWKLPIGLADLEYSRDNATPKIRMWFKGDVNIDNLEARLFYNGQQIASTDDRAGGLSREAAYYAQKRGDDQSLYWREISFSWPNRIEFIMTEELRTWRDYKNAKFINQMPGDYVVKVYYNGEQVRETKFSIGNNGTYADNGIAHQSKLTTNKVILPVKVMGTLDKWNPVNAKAMGFYGNPVVGVH